MSTYNDLKELFGSIADAIRSKKGATAPIASIDMPAEILSIPTGGGPTPEEVKEPYVLFIDYNGDILGKKSIENINSEADFPAVPSHNGIVFNEWNWTVEEIKEYNKNCTVGATYKSADGKTHFKVTALVDGDEGATLGLYRKSGGDAPQVDVDWGDGQTQKITVTNTSRATFSHNYTKAGTYEVTLNVLNGAVYLSGATLSSAFSKFPATTNSYGSNRRLDNCEEVIIGDNTNLAAYAFARMSGLKSVVIPSETEGPNTTKAQIFDYCTNLKAVVIPRTEKLGLSFLNPCNFQFLSISGNSKVACSVTEGCKYLGNVSIPNGLAGATIATGLSFKGIDSYRGFFSIPDGMTNIPTDFLYNIYGVDEIKLPNSLTSTQNRVFYGTGIKEIHIPDNLKTLGTDNFYNCYRLEKVTGLKGLTGTLPDNTFRNCYALKEIDLPNTITGIGANTFNRCSSLGGQMVVPDTCSTIGASAFQYCSNISSFVLPPNYTTINAYTFSYTAPDYFDFSRHTQIPTLSNSNAFTGIPTTTKIKVPSALYNSWKTATNWTTYASQIVAV